MGGRVMEGKEPIFAQKKKKEGSAKKKKGNGVQLQQPPASSL